MDRAELERSFAGWLKTRPECVQKLAARFPVGHVYVIDGVKHYILGWTENDMVIFSLTDPSQDYKRAMANKVYLCADHLEARDPTPWCSGCGAMRQADCHCGPIAKNE